MFSATHSTFCCSAKIKKGYFAKHQNFFYCKTRVVRTIAMLLLHNNFLVFNISDNCRESSHNLWTLPNHNSWSLEGLGFRACYSGCARSPTAPFWKPNVLGELQESVPLEMTDKSLRVKLVIVSLLEHNLNHRISHFHFF